MTQLLLTVAALTIAGLLSPGPNFLLISGRALSSGVRPALATAMGVTAGSLTHAVFGIAGFGALLRSSSGLFTAAKLIGATYLIWIGLKSLRGAVRAKRAARAVATGVGDVDPGHAVGPTVGPRRSALDGYLTQMSNPKSTLFFLALFTTVVPAETTVLEATAVVATVVLLALIGYALIALLFSRPVLQRSYRRVGYVFDAVFGMLMTALGVRIAVSER